MRIAYRLLLLLPLLLVTACGSIVHQSRYIPRAEALTWDKDYKQLPWREPSLGAEHYERRGRPAKPQFAYETNYSVMQAKNEYRYENDGKGTEPQ